MATSEPEVLLGNLSGDLDLSGVFVYNIVNIRQHVINSFEKMHNFCVQLNLLKRDRNCPRCRKNLKLSIKQRPHHRTPVFFRCTNSSFSKVLLSKSPGQLSLSSLLGREMSTCSKLQLDVSYLS